MIDSSDRLPVEALAAEYAERLRQGQSVDIQEYIDRHPELSAEIRDLFPAVDALERWKRRRARRPGPALRRLGDFRIVGEIGRGGMGIVYEAVQESLGRHVALKVLPKQAVLDEKRLRRFRREARTAARLHHSNIVPVLGIGDVDGHRFIVMQYIRGVGLDEIIAQLNGVATGNAERRARAERLAAGLTTGRLVNRGPANGDSSAPLLPGASGPSGHHSARWDPASTSDRLEDQAEHEESEVGPFSSRPACDAASKLAKGQAPAAPAHSAQAVYWENIARLGMQAAAALSYAHQVGTLHRDIKPGNLLLDEHATLWVADFGLATAAEQDNVTQSGDIVGTLRYSAPEQLRGAADPRSDIFSLGLSLYELLTLRPGFVQRRVHDAPTTLTPPRKLNPDVPRDLETIVLKAVAPDTQHRYQQAHELLEDLAAFVEDRPIRARRVGSFERLWRWCRRNRALAAATASAATLLVIVAVVASAGYFATKSAFHEKHAALQSEQLQREKAEATLEITARAVDRLFQGFVPDRFMDAEEFVRCQPPAAAPAGNSLESRERRAVGGNVGVARRIG